MEATGNTHDVLDHEGRGRKATARGFSGPRGELVAAVTALNFLEANHVHDLGKGLLSDLGGVTALEVDEVEQVGDRGRR
jgi:hypothetical protein